MQADLPPSPAPGPVDAHIGQGQDGRGRPWPVEFTFYGYRGADPGASMDTTISSLAATTVSAAVQGGGLYCFYLRNLVQVAPDPSNAERTQYWQGVNLRMAIQP
jgi:hypothetical protein